jgi:hypothetical protein
MRQLKTKKQATIRRAHGRLDAKTVAKRCAGALAVDAPAADDDHAAVDCRGAMAEPPLHGLAPEDDVT